MYLLAGVAAAHLVDAWTTVSAIEHPAFREVNPLMKSVMSMFGPMGVVGVKLGYVGYLWYSMLDEPDEERERQYFLGLLLGLVPSANNLGEIVGNGHGSVLWSTVLPGQTPGVT